MPSFCKFEDEQCYKQSKYNFVDQKGGIYCLSHIKPGMVNVYSKKCQFEETPCNIRPSYNFSDQKNGIYCVSHIKPHMIDVESKKCQTELCETQVCRSKYKGHCVRCFMFKFPDEPVARNYKTKEKHFTDFIQSEFSHLDLIFDKMVNNGCSKRRPDNYIDLLTHVIINECDENQHDGYSCENKRMMELFQDFAHRPIVFIRFNPDKYVDDKNNIVKSCFKVHKKSGVLIVDDKSDWERRLEVLKETINTNVNTIPNKEVTIVNLFYDNTVATKKRKREN